MQVDREFTEEDRACINPCASLSITAAMEFVKNPVRCCAHVHTLIQSLVRIVITKKDDPKTKGYHYVILFGKIAAMFKIILRILNIVQAFAYKLMAGF